MPAKAPIYLKNGGGKNGHGNGRKLRELLSAEMISPPLGDFRHMAHVGRGGAEDMFGDTTFLQKDNLNGEPENSDSVTTLPRRESKKRSKKQRNHSTPDENSLNAEVKSLTTHDGYGPAQSPILQSAFSLPLLTNGKSPSPEPQESKKAGVKKTMNNNCVGNKSSPDKNSPVLPDQTPNGNPTGPPKPRRLMDETVASIKPQGLRSADVYTERPYDLGDTTSITDGWDLDLGSSLMDDVMGIMDKIEL